MSEQTGALAGLRGAIDERVEADRARAFALMLQDETVMQDHLLRIKIANLDTELARVESIIDAALGATVEARIDRLVRFVRAWDAFAALPVYDDWASWMETDELRAARDALAPEDLA